MKLKSTEIIITLEPRAKLDENQAQELRKMFPEAHITVLKHYEEVSELTNRR